jgi:hypothetical protein
MIAVIPAPYVEMRSPQSPLRKRSQAKSGERRRSPLNQVHDSARRLGVSFDLAGGRGQIGMSGEHLDIP